ncbi:hypothetical protein NL676_017789 [Syzygium grande]|nr:hypothetical protein NL676_017789 [Syzygium grande]
MSTPRVFRIRTTRAVADDWNGDEGLLRIRSYEVGPVRSLGPPPPAPLAVVLCCRLSLTRSSRARETILVFFLDRIDVLLSHVSFGVPLLLSLAFSARARPEDSSPRCRLETTRRRVVGDEH